MSQMLEEVVSPGGTAPHVAIPGYRIAGKTGTANRADGGGYSGYTTSAARAVAASAGRSSRTS